MSQLNSGYSVDNLPWKSHIKYNLRFLMSVSVRRMVSLACCIPRTSQTRRRRIDRSMIGNPMDFRHTSHLGRGDLDRSSISSSMPIDEVMCSKGGYLDLRRDSADDPRTGPSLIHLKLIDLHPREVDSSIPPPVPPHAFPLASQNSRL